MLIPSLYLTNSTNENDVLFSNDTGILGKRNSEFSQQESNLRPLHFKLHMIIMKKALLIACSSIN